jgi:uncharacterized repeat protein (TIGR01451 family)
MIRRKQAVLNFLVVLTLMLSVIGIAPSGAAQPATGVTSAPLPASGVASPATQNNGPTSVETASDQALDKFSNTLADLAHKGGTSIVGVRVLTPDQAITWPDFAKLVPLATPDEATGLKVWYGQVKASDLTKLASLDYVTYGESLNMDNVVPRFRDPDQSTGPMVTQAARDRLQQLRDNPPLVLQKPQSPTGWWDVGPGHESKLAWDKGYTGSGVTVADIDSGVDFCHPDLYGTWKTYSVASSRNVTYTVYTQYPYQPVSVPNYYSYYNGWPEMLSPFSNYALFFDLWYNGTETDANTFAYGYSKFADTRATGTGDVISFDGKVYTTTGTASIFNPVYHIGYHPDTSLEGLWWGERIAVLVVDENGDGVYDTVYVDLNDNHDFSDDQPANKGNPAACWDADGDGKADLSGGLVYFIADGYHFPAMMDWWFGPQSYGLPAPGSGELVAFMFDDILGPAAAHGTLTAGNIVGQGVADGDPSVYGGTPRPTWKPAGVGGMVQGGGKNAKLIAVGDSYINFTASTEEAWYFASFGVDGYGDTNDGAQITSNSYGESATDNDEWDNRSRLLTRLNTRTSAYRGYPAIYNQQVAHLVSTGNGAPGYGTVTSADASTAINIGASTQFGSTADFDSISGPDQIVWGDVIPWSNRGPTAVGHLAPSVTADGAFAAGDITLNGAFGDGNAAWESWGGTSRSAPVAAGNLALIYDAFKQRTGVYPTWQQAKELFMNGASDQKNDVLVQGAGAVNADLATDIAGGKYGLHVTPSAWYPGSYRGTDYLAFSQIITPGGTDSQVFTFNNFGPLTTTANLTATYLTKVSSSEFTVTLNTANESAYDFARPDYLWNVNQYAPSGIPAGTDLMVAEVIQPFGEFATGNTALNNNWRIVWYSAKDVNANGRLWQDANGNGAVNAGEIDAGEYVRFSYGYNIGTYHQVSVKDPLNRWKDGIYLGLQHRNRTSGVPATHLSIRVTYYKKTAWPWLTLNTPSVQVYPNSSATVTATASIPANTPYGIYEGAIEVSLPANGSYSARTTIVPVVVNVGFSGDVAAAPITLGGTPPSNTRLDNGAVNGSQDWSWRAESGDWRFFFLDQTITPTVGSRLVVKDQWADPAPETDIDTLLLGPASGPYTRVQAPFLFNLGDFSSLDPATFGPYRLEVGNKSTNRNVSAGIWAFQTATGGNTEYVVAPLGNGLNEVMQHSVRYQGDKFNVPFTKTLSTLTGPMALTYTNYFTDNVAFAANITHTNGLTVEVYGLSTVHTDINSTITQDPTNGNPCDFAAGGVYTYTFTLGGNVAKFKAHVFVGSNDYDMYLAYNATGTPACPSGVIASSTNGAGTDDEVTVNFPKAGNYMVIIQGWAVSPSPTPFSWYWERTDLDSSVAMRNASLSIGPSKPATFELYNAPGACNDAKATCNQGIIYVGFPDAPRLFSVPVTVNYANASFVGSTKLVSASTAKPGDVLTYTVNLTNTGVVTATAAQMTDTLPTAVTFGGLVSGGATYSATLNAVLWTGDVAPGASASIVFTATVNTVSNGTVIANSANVNNGLGTVTTVGPANTTVTSINLSTSSKAVDKASAVPGDVLTYTIVVRNTGPTNAANATLADVLPAHTTYVNGSVTGSATYSSTLNSILWNGPLAASSAVTVTYQAHIVGPLANGTVITNTAQVGDGLGKTWLTNETDTTVSSADLSTSSKTANKTLVASGERITFTIKIDNTGFASSAATMVDALPAGLTLIGTPSVQTGPGSVIFAGNTVTWTGTLDSAYNNQARVQLSAVVGTLSLCQKITNVATVSDGQGNQYVPSVTVGGPCYKTYMPIVRR